MPFGFEKVDLGRLKMSRSRLPGLLPSRMPAKWRMVVVFPFGRRSEIIAMGLGKHARHFHGYGEYFTVPHTFHADPRRIHVESRRNEGNGRNLLGISCQ